MSRIVLLDTGVLGMIAHPRIKPELVTWLQSLEKGGAKVFVPEIADYELRRELLHRNKTKSIQRLDALKKTGYLAITTDIMLKAAEFWAKARKRGRPTADSKALDADMILSAQAESVSKNNKAEEVIIATTNVGHLSLFCDAREWHNI